jgi:phosphate/sulfate permease
MGSTIPRVVFAVALVLLTWNPSGWSYVDWALRDRSAFDAVKAFFGVLLFGGWVFCVRSAWVSLGAVGLVLVGALLATVVWMLVQFGVVEPGSTKTLLWIGLVAVGVVLGVGLSWSKVKQRATGQVETD